jgi:hypothetical protein
MVCAVIAHALNGRARLGNAFEQVRQFPTSRYQESGVIQPGCTLYPPGAALRSQTQQIRLAGPQTSRIAVPPVQLEAQQITVKGNLTVQIRDRIVDVP